MERDIQPDNRRSDDGFDWPEIVAGAKLRRNEMKLTQRRLAAVAGVSLPTVVQFEAGKDVRISSALAILKVLELVATPVEGVLLLHSAGAAGGPFKAMFAPYGGMRGGARDPVSLPDLPALDTFLNALHIPAEAKQRALANLSRDRSADVPSLRLMPSEIRRHWPMQSTAAPH
jgi:transcriptional regulator with XRE-family HTH domain